MTLPPSRGGRSGSEPRRDSPPRNIHAAAAAASRPASADYPRATGFPRRSQVGELRGIVDRVTGALGAAGVHLDGRGFPAPKRPRVDRQDSEQLFLERLPSSVRVGSIDFAPHSLDGNALSPRLDQARGLEGQPLRRVGGPAPTHRQNSLDGVALNSFEGARLESLVRLASEEREAGEAA